MMITIVNDYQIKKGLALNESLFWELMESSSLFVKELRKELEPYFESGWAEIALVTDKSRPNKGVTTVSFPRDPGYLWQVPRTKRLDYGNPYERNSCKRLFVVIE